MKSIKLLGLAAITALAAMAFVGAGSASATTLCEVNVGGGECPYKVALPTTMLGYAAPVQFSVNKNPLGSCSSSQMRLKAEKNLGAGKGISGQLSSFSLAGCDVLPSCAPGPEVRNLPYKAELHETAGGNGALTLSSGGAGNPTLRFTGCLDHSGGHSGTCNFSAEKLELGFEGAASPKAITASNEHLADAGCYVLGGLDVSAGYGVQDLDFSATSSEIAMKNSANETMYKCGGSAMGGSMAGTISSLTFSGCGPSPCTTAKALNLPYGTSYSPSGMESGTMNVSGFKWEISGCPFGVTCKYTSSGASLALDVEGSKVIASKEPLKLENPGLCSLLAAGQFLSGTYTKSGLILALAANP